MQYRLRVTREASEDVTGLAGYIARKFANIDAALNFLDKYDKEVQRLTNFPFGYRGVSFEYRGYEIRIKSFGTYNVFFTVDIAEKQVFVLRVLKDRQDWKTILGSQDEYHFEQNGYGKTARKESGNVSGNLTGNFSLEQNDR